MSASTASASAPVRVVLAALESLPVKLLVVGGIGSGKSTALEAVRRSLRDSGHAVAARVPRHRDDGAALVIDDAHLLGASELHRLTELAEDPDRTVVVATEARDHDPGLAALGRILEAERRNIPIYILRSNTVMQMEQCLVDIFHIPSDPVDVFDEAMRETQDGIQRVLNGSTDDIELSPQSATIRGQQHQLARAANLISHSYGREPYRRVRIFRKSLA